MRSHTESEWSKCLTEGVLAAIGNSPMVQLKRIFLDTHFHLFAKLEATNPGGSSKDRAALSIISKAIEKGRIRPGTTIIESSSGNMGIGLAQICAYLDLRFICVVDPKTTNQNLDLLKAYGAVVDMVTDCERPGDFLQARIDRVQALLRLIPDSYWPNQYANHDNAKAYYQTMREIGNSLGRDPDYLFCATSTCGTVRGCAEYVRTYQLKTKVIAVDAIGSVIFGGKARKRLIPGHGAARRPELYAPKLAEECVHVSDLDCVVGCRRLVLHEAIMAGGSSGGVITAVERFKHEIPKDATCVVILPDRGERYLDTIYSDTWVKEHFGDVSHLWENARAAA
ncbi:MAG TPA: 2,3-diaminopropionate biosynthesis protein SbnA [Pyrinomonadaceae bacterium]|nr:2,3-diaminopropionate biosynthesis protein SbnA [Pyrinomonadaceae bacterium]